MLHIKKLHSYIYQLFFPYLIMTTSVVIFVFVIQQVWQHIDKLVGKGLGVSVILEFLFYIIMVIIPQAIPLGILLASLMVFGSMGEKLELLAIKASGVSLIRIMSPLIVLVSIITVCSFFYQDRLVPMYNVKMRSLMSSLTDKKPEVAIPEGSFYTDVDGFSIYVGKKNPDTRMLYDVIIYDLSSGFRNVAVDFCDSAFVETAPSKDYQILTLYNGERFANINNASSSPKKDFVPNMREKYEKKTINIPFSTELTRLNEDAYENTYLSKTLNELQTSIDSLNRRLDSINIIDRESVKSISIFKESFSLNSPVADVKNKANQDTTAIENNLPVSNKKIEVQKLNFDSVLASYSKRQQSELITSAMNQAKSSRISNLAYTHFESPKPILQKNIWMHRSFYLMVFSLSFSCLIFFFIGASLGAIIGKGGMGVPVILCVVLFIIYYMINNVGRKLAQNGSWEVWQGMWLSTAILLPIAIFFTYKSMRESALFNVEAYNMFFRRILRIKSNPLRPETREPRFEEIPTLSSLNVNPEIIDDLNAQDNKNLKDMISNYQTYFVSPELGRDYQLAALALLKKRKTYLFDVKVNNYDYNYSKQILAWIASFVKKILVPTFIAIFCLLMIQIKITMVLAIVVIVIYLFLLMKVSYYLGDFYRSINQKNKNVLIKISNLFFPKLASLQSFLFGLILILFLPLTYHIIGKKLNRLIENIKGKSF